MSLFKRNSHQRLRGIHNRGLKVTACKSTTIFVSIWLLFWRVCRIARVISKFTKVESIDFISYCIFYLIVLVSIWKWANFISLLIIIHHTCCQLIVWLFLIKLSFFSQELAWIYQLYWACNDKHDNSNSEGHIYIS